MDPAVITALATFFTALNGWTVGTVIIFVFVVPPLLGLVAATRIATAMSSIRADGNTQVNQMITEIRAANEANNKRFEAVVSFFERAMGDFENRYENNIYLVKNWEKLANDMINLVAINSTASTRLVDKIDQLISSLNKQGK